MGKSRSTSTTGELVEQIKLALGDDGVIATLANRTATMVADKINNRLDHLEKALTEKDARINQLEQAVDTGITGFEDGEQLDKFVTDLFDDMGLKPTTANINRTHRIGPRNKQTTFTTNNSVVQGLQVKRRLPKGKKNYFVPNDRMSSFRKILLKSERDSCIYAGQHNVLDYWSYDGRIGIKDLNGRIKTTSQDRGGSERTVITLDIDCSHSGQLIFVMSYYVSAYHIAFSHMDCKLRQ